MMRRLNWFIILVVLLSACGAQEQTQNTTVERSQDSFEVETVASFEQAQQLELSGHREEAIAMLHDVVLLNDHDVSSMNTLAWIEWRQKHYDAALQWLRRAQSLAPDYADVYRQQALIYEETGETEKMIDSCLSFLYWELRRDKNQNPKQVFDYMTRNSYYAVARIQDKIEEEQDSYRWKELLDLYYDYLDNYDDPARTKTDFQQWNSQNDKAERPSNKGIWSAEEAGIQRYRYDEPINGYTVTMEWIIGTQVAEYCFTKGGRSFRVESNSFNPAPLDPSPVGEEKILYYHPKPKGQMLYDQEPFFFTDIDFDGTEELIIVELQAGPRGANAYRVFEPDGTEREDDPFIGISDWTTFNASEKSITLFYYYGVILGGTQLKYRRQRDGTFALTDSTHIDYKTDFSDSLRTHYRKQGNEMALVKQEVVK